MNNQFISYVRPIFFNSYNAPILITLKFLLPLLPFNEEGKDTRVLEYENLENPSIQNLFDHILKVKDIKDKESDRSSFSIKKIIHFLFGRHPSHLSRQRKVEMKLNNFYGQTEENLSDLKKDIRVTRLKDYIVFKAKTHPFIMTNQYREEANSFIQKTLDKE